MKSNIGCRWPGYYYSLYDTDWQNRLERIDKNVEPKQILGDYVFCVVQELSTVPLHDIIMFFKEEEGITVILKKDVADERQLAYTVVLSWITLTVHSSLEAVGLTATFSKALAEKNISGNVVAGYYHDHIFISKKDAERAILILNNLSQ